MDERSQNAARDSRTILERSLQDSGVSISQQDLELRYTHFFNTHPGMASENMIGKTDYDWLPKAEADRLVEIKVRALEGREGVREMFKSSLNNGKDGHVYYNDIRVEPIKEAGRVVGIYTVAIDITKFQKALDRLESLNGRLLKHMESQLDVNN